MSGAISNPRARSYPAPEDAPTGTVCRRIFIPDDRNIIAALNDVIAYLCNQSTWEASENVSQIDMEAIMTEMWHDFAADECPE